ncbi:hypothetical protein FEM03_22210 [Phragmitibacter flavus]|uniref:Uncharacterized protein n=1 Tax=Phragmitibacter flavus TaxID=2576071 RepID=A0A5R8K852_9BACT|nr:hypothetical protein [Phragmitibacter flavus]TLD68522.1 hypothetical protein FEM03_22210 [Phragmitibacter flavus]
MITRTHPSRIQATPFSSVSKSHSFGSVKVKRATKNFGFQIQTELTSDLPELTFALTAASAPSAGQFAIHINFNTGEITDAANQTGVMGCLHQRPSSLSHRRQPLVLRWFVEHHGGALIPRLEIGDEEWLYPAVRFSPDCEYVATASTNPSMQLSQAYVWCQDYLGK